LLGCVPPDLEGAPHGRPPAAAASLGRATPARLPLPQPQRQPPPRQPKLAVAGPAELVTCDQTIEHTYRFAKTTLGWDDPALRHPDQFDRWTWLAICAINQLRLARTIAEDQPRPWERRRRPDRLTPGRVRRDFARLLPLLGTPANPPKPSKAGPGRPKGRRSAPAPRYDVIKKAA